MPELPIQLTREEYSRLTAAAHFSDHTLQCGCTPQTCKEANHLLNKYKTRRDYWMAL